MIATIGKQASQVGKMTVRASFQPLRFASRAAHGQSENQPKRKVAIS